MRSKLVIYHRKDKKLREREKSFVLIALKKLENKIK